MQPLTDREREHLALALSNYGDVRAHAPVRMCELLDLVEKLGVPAGYLTKGLAQAMAARLRAREERAVKGGAP